MAKNFLLNKSFYATIYEKAEVLGLTWATSIKWQTIHSLIPAFSASKTEEDQNNVSEVVVTCLDSKLNEKNINNFP